MLRRSGILRVLPYERLLELASEMRPVDLESEAYLFLQEEPGDSLYLVERGRLRVFRTTPDGREVSLAHLSAGDIIGEMALLDGLERSASVQALEPSRLWRLDRQAFTRVLQEDPRLAVELLELLARRLREANRHLEEAAGGPVVVRLARLLQRMSGGSPAPAAVVSLRLTQQELANLAGTTRESVNRGLQRLQRQGIVVRRGRGRLWVDRGRLAAALPGDPWAG